MKPIKTHDSENEEEESEAEEDASPPASDEDEEMGEEEEEDEETQEDGDQPAGENSGSEDSLKEPDRHPYPTPPPDDGSKMAPLDALVKSKQKTMSEGAKKGILPYLSNDGHRKAEGS